MINKIRNWLFRDYHKLMDERVEELKAIESAFEQKKAQIVPVYTTIRAMQGTNAEYYGWTCALLASDEFKYFLFDLRENILRELVGMEDSTKIQRHIGRLEMINVVENYLKRLKLEYEDKILRSEAHS